jgi:hypothetical protein
MLHTSNSTAPAGVLHSPVPGQPDEESSVPAGRPVARKSQIIEEEEDAEEVDEEIEEVDEFDGPEDESGPALPEKDPKTSALEPAPELEASPIRPPRSSSLRSPRSKTDAMIAVVAESTESKPEDTTATEHTGDAAAEPAPSTK